MQTVNFNCPFCGKLMAVGINLVGRNVRCPHCKQVVQAPASIGAAPPLQPSAESKEPSFTIATEPRESHESIFGEVQDDDVFGTRQPKVSMPGEPAAKPPRPREPEATVEMPHPPEPTQPPVSPKADTIPEYTPPRTQPWEAPSPSALRDTPGEPLENTVDEAPPPRSSYQPRPAAREGGSGALVWILLLYSALATAGAAYLFFNSNKAGEPNTGANKQEQQHPFTAIPDLYGHYEKADRKKVARLEGMPAASLDVPDHLRVPLNGKLAIGALEVTPKQIDFREVTRFDKPAGSGKFDAKLLPRSIYRLHLHVKNTSEDIVLHPTDPAFNAIYATQRPGPTPVPYTGIFFGKDQRFAGGVWIWPDAQYERQYIEGQENDDKPLRPQEERDYVIASTIDTNKIREELRKLGPEESALWHVQLRIGLIPWKDGEGKEREISTTSVIGVPFRDGDVFYPR